MAEYLTTDTDLQSVADAIRAKSGTSEPLEYPDGFVSAIEDIPTGGGGGGSAAVPEKQVNFYDYDGTCVYSYTPSEFAALTEMPANPSHEGLTAQGWNWSLSDAKSYVADYGMLDVGQMYITDDGKTRIYIHLEQGRTSPMLGVCPRGTVDVDWGDGTEHDTLTGTSLTTVKWTSTHNYAAPGDYVIKLTVDGSMRFFGNNGTNQKSCLLRYSLNGDGRNIIYQSSVNAIEIGNGISDLSNEYSFSSLYNLRTVTIPMSIEQIGNGIFTSCYSLKAISVPLNVHSLGAEVFRYDYILENIILPNNDSISFGANSFGSSRAARHLCVPPSVKSIGGGAFSYCTNMAIFVFTNQISFIDSNAFEGCYGLGELHFKSATPPTVSNSNVFANLPADCKIYVPTGSLEAYTSATNYPSSAIYTYIEE